MLGQTNFDCRDENGGGAPTASSMRWPHAIARWGGKFCVSRTRVTTASLAMGTPCRAATTHPRTAYWGQRDFERVDHNQSLYWPSAATLQMPYGIAAEGPWCIAADTANSRLIAWHLADCQQRVRQRARSPANRNSMPRATTGGALPTRDSLSWPYGVSVREGMAVIADSGNNRVLVWPLAPELSAEPPA